MTRRILVDGQVLQTTAKDRGMGRYTISILQSILAQPGVVMEIVLSKNLTMGPSLIKELEELLPGAKFSELNLWSLKTHTIESAIEHNQAALTEYVAGIGANEIDYFIPSLFQDPGVAVFPEGVRTKGVLFHDLIPYLYHGRYEKFMGFANYLKRFRFIFEADILFTNSQTVADDLHLYLGVPKRKLCRVDGAAIIFDRTLEKPEVTLDKPYVLFNTSDDPRKNNLRAVLGFEEYRRTHNPDMLLVATSTINRSEQEKLRSISPNIVFTGSVTWQQVNWLFENCEAVLFVSESEGLGLPLLEAVEFDKKVVASAISVLQEISPDEHAFYFCNHESPSSIAQGLQAALAPGAKTNKEAYKIIKELYTWDHTAKRLVDRLNDFKAPSRPTAKPKIAVFTAIPSGKSGVGLTHAAILHPSLADVFDIDYYIESGLSTDAVRPNYLQYVANCYPAQAFSVERYAQYDAVVYHMGNSDYHLESIKNSLYLPGYVIVHDTNLTEAYRVLKETGMMTEERVLLESELDRLGNTETSKFYASVASRQLGILTHSQYAANAMKEVATDVPVRKSHLATNVPVLDAVRSTRKLCVGLAGAIADVKGLGIIESIARDPSFGDVDIKLFGFNHASEETISRLRSYENVSVATDVSDYEFQNSVRSLDVYINYRLVYKGESSNSTLEALRQGAAVIVRDIGWYAELPDDVAVKVKSEDEVLPALAELLAHPDKMRELGKRAKSYVEQHYTYDTYVNDLAALIAGSSNANTIIAKRVKSGAVQSVREYLAALEGNGHES